MLREKSELTVRIEAKTVNNAQISVSFKVTGTYNSNLVLNDYLKILCLNKLGEL